MKTSGIFVTDFDGTMTQDDFYTLAVERHTPPGALRHWKGFEEGTVTHFEALQRIFAEMTSTPEQRDQLLVDMQFDPLAATVIREMQSRGWRILVASAGCEWYIKKLFAAAGIDVELYSNPGTIDANGALQMELPVGRPYFHSGLGVDKAGIVRAALQASDNVYFAGDGLPDLEAALLVPADRRFARGSLAAALNQRGERYRKYATWSHIAKEILEASQAGSL